MNEAEDMYLRALAGYEKAWGLDDKKPLDTRYNLAIMYEKRSLFENAAQHMDLVVDCYNKLLGPEY